jgi:hypothetical protein
LVRNSWALAKRKTPEEGILDKPDSAKPAQRSSNTGTVVETAGKRDKKKRLSETLKRQKDKTKL